MRKDSSKSRYYSQRYNEKVDIFWDSKNQNWVVYLNGKYFTEYPEGEVVNSRHLNEALRFRKKVPEHLRTAERKQKDARDAHDESYARTRRDICMGMAKDLVDYGFMGKKHFTNKD